MRIAALALGLVVVAGACASQGTASADQAPTAATTARRTNIITTQEIRESRAATLADMIRQLRPGWPQNGVTIFVNNDPFGGYEVLRTLPMSTTTEVRYMTLSEAQTRWSSRAQTAVIQVVTR